MAELEKQNQAQGNSRGPNPGKNMVGITDQTVKLYVGGIEGWSGDKVKEILSKSGNVRRVDIVKNFSFAFVENQAAADKILKELHLKTIEGKKLIIQISKNKQNMPDCDESCFECGQTGHWAKDCEQRRARLSKRDGGPPASRGRGRGGPPPIGRGRLERPEDPYSDPRALERDPLRPGLADVYRRDPYARDLYARDPYGRDPYARDPYARDPYSRDPYARDPYSRDPYSRDPYVRDPYPRDLYAGRDPYSRDLYSRETPYSRDPYARDPIYRDPHSRDPYTYRDRSPPPPARPAAPLSRTYDDPYAAAREKLAYGYSYSGSKAPPSDPYDKSPLPKPAGGDIARSTDPYDRSRPEAVTTYRYGSERPATSSGGYDNGYDNYAPPTASSQYGERSYNSASGQYTAKDSVANPYSTMVPYDRYSAPAGPRDDKYPDSGSRVKADY